MNKLLVLTVVTMLAQFSVAAPGRMVEPVSKRTQVTTKSAARPLETLAAHENLIRLQKNGINNTNLRTMAEKGEISADALKTYADVLDSSATAPATKSAIRNILEVLGSEKDAVSAKGNKLKALETFQRFAKDIAPALLKEGNADVVDLITTAGSVVVSEGGAAAIYRAVGKKFQLDGQKALDKIEELRTCKI
jgi:hypothetical protein